MHFLFDDYVLDLDRRELTRESTAIAIGPQVFDLLIYLVQNRERVVSKDNLLDAVWGGRIVSESTLTSHINAVRKAIGDSGEEQRLVRTIARKGFRFVGEVSEAHASDGVNPPKPEPAARDEATPPARALPDKPSIAVLAFQNLSGDPEQEYFADGVVEDIITALSRIRWLFVIARNSSFTYKGRAVDVKQVGRELNVRYILEGSVRRSGNRLRIGGQLIDATTALQIWSDRFEGEVADIFALQDRIAESVVGALVPQVRDAEMNRARRAPTESIDAHLAYMRAMGFFYTWSRDGLDKALELSYRAIKLDPDYAPAYGLALGCFFMRRATGWGGDAAHELAEARRLCERVYEIGRDNFLALGSAGFALAGLLGEHERGAALIDESLVLNPNASATLMQSSFVRTWMGQPELAIQQLQRAMLNSPVDVLMFTMHTGMALAHFVAERDDEAYAWAEKALQRNPIAGPAIRVAAASAALLGRPVDAAKYLSLLRQLDPGLRASNLAGRIPLRRPQDLERLANGLRKAGLPEH